MRRSEWANEHSSEAGFTQLTASLDLNQNSLQHLRGIDAGEAKVEALGAEGESFVIEAELVE